MGGKAESAFWPRLSQGLALKWNGHPPPPLTRCLPSGFLHRGAIHRQDCRRQGQPVCSHLQWVGSYFLVCVGPHSIPGGSEIQLGTLLGVKRITTASTSPIVTNGGQICVLEAKVTPVGWANPASTGHGAVWTLHKIANTALPVPSHSPPSPN